jgi:hypothetical protein
MEDFQIRWTRTVEHARRPKPIIVTADGHGAGKYPHARRGTHGRGAHDIAKYSIHGKNTHC